MTNIDKLFWTIKLNHLATSKYCIHHITGHKIDNFIYWLEDNQDFKNMDVNDILNRNTSIQNNINPNINKIQILMYLEKEFLQVSESNLHIFIKIYELYEDLL
ncbi:hypothetical protein NAL32_21315 [Chryseobacterium sp. Ch-15]|uniref:Uncharacterized protein n=1 Tax=Chryseobacterium muglaense TaxID=2893752 RepID=A0A9Q3USQ0_9FLAO|nr:hypothetical protein [Chryseobacterium muglaense]MCC9033030.1 hypothetical protein [Chryseobacterium muglaense]MCM2556933.1 hypothetical protein [Chryseobacterium muglaense]